MTRRPTCGIKAYITERNVTAAKTVIGRIRKTLALLAVLPRLGHGGRVRGTLEKGVPHLPYLIIYRIDAADAGHEIVVLRVYQSRKNDNSRYTSVPLSRHECNRR